MAMMLTLVIASVVMLPARQAEQAVRPRPLVPSVARRAALATAFDYSVRDASGRTVALKPLAGKLLLVVNTPAGATDSERGRQIESLKTTYSEHLHLLAFPSDSFSTADGSPPVATGDLGLAKVTLTGEKIDPFFAFLLRSTRGENRITGDYSAFLVNRVGRPIGVFEPTSSLEPLVAAIEAEIAKGVR
jgi:glutathione peroxidase-family protein